MDKSCYPNEYLGIEGVALTFKNTYIFFVVKKVHFGSCSLGLEAFWSRPFNL